MTEPTRPPLSEGPTTGFLLGSLFSWTVLTALLLNVGASETVGAIMVGGYFVHLAVWLVVVALFAPGWQEARRQRT